MKESKIFKPEPNFSGSHSWEDVISIHDRGFKGIIGSVNLYATPKDSRKECFKKLPEYVSGFVNISKQKIRSLEHCPKEIGGNLHCYNNKLKVLGASYPITVNENLCMHETVTEYDHRSGEQRLIETKYMNRIHTVGEMHVKGNVVGFDVESFLWNEPSDESILNAIELLSSCENSDMYEEGITELQSVALSDKIVQDTAPKMASPTAHRF